MKRVIVHAKPPRKRPEKAAQASKITQHVITAKRPSKRVGPFLRALKAED